MSFYNSTDVYLFKTPGNEQWVNRREIVRLQGDGNYTWIHLVDGKKYLIAVTLKRWTERLPDFLRLNKTDLVNPVWVLSYVNPIKPAPDLTGSKTASGTVHYQVRLSNGHRLDWSRRRFRQYLSTQKEKQK